MMSRRQLDRIAQRITGKDIRLVGFWEALPGLVEHRAAYARELGVSEAALLRCRDIIEVLDLSRERRTSSAQETGPPVLF